MGSRADADRIPSSYWLGSERRRNPRNPFIAQVDCSAEDTFGLGRTLDLSESGLLMAAPEPLEPGTPVEVRFVVPVEPQVVTVQATGTVVRTDHDRNTMAIRFTEIDDYDRAAIRRLFEQGGSK